MPPATQPPSDPVLAHLRADDREQAGPRTHVARRRRSMGATVTGLPRRADAISKAGVRLPDTGRVLRHVSNHADEVDRTIAFGSRDLDAPAVSSATRSRRRAGHYREACVATPTRSWAPLLVQRRSGGIAHKRNGLEGELAARKKLLPESGWMCRQLERGQLSVMNVCLDGEEQVVAACVIPVFDRRTHGPDPAGHQFICLTRTRKCGVVVSRDEHHGRSRA
jgi:hypothetical protein